MKKVLIYLTAGILLISCGGRGANSNAATAHTADGLYCYVSTENRDTVNIRFDLKQGLVNGELSYRLFEKDASTGHIKGYISGDTLIADYLYSSEGMSSTREVIFLFGDNTLTEGYGEMEEKDRRFVFSDRSDIHFGDGIRLNKEACP